MEGPNFISDETHSQEYVPTRQCYPLPQPVFKLISNLETTSKHKKPQNIKISFSNHGYAPGWTCKTQMYHQRTRDQTKQTLHYFQSPQKNLIKDICFQKLTIFYSMPLLQKVTYIKDPMSQFLTVSKNSAQVPFINTRNCTKETY